MADDTRERHLLERPQRLGILPTFWNDHDNWKLVYWPFAGFVFASALILAALSLPCAVEFGLFLATYSLLLGSVEKYVRRQALKRRELADAEATQALES